MKYSPDEHDGRPAAPESEKPETDAHLSHLNLPDGNKVGIPIETVALLRSLERRLSPAQTEIKGHMRVKDDLEHALECERMKVAGCSTAAIGYWKEGDSLHPEYDCAAIHDVARLYKEYAEASAGLTIMTKIRDSWFKRADLAEFELAQAQARIAELEKDRDSWKREAEMIGNAWQRELCDQGILYRHKTHWIDFMVLATRKVMAIAKENGVSCCDQPELCAKTDCNKLLRYRLAALKSRA